jgi:hypothetical protein
MAVSPCGWKRAITSPTTVADFDVRAIGSLSLVPHRIEDPAMDGLQPVADVGQRPRDDDRHRVLEERALHLELNIDWFDRVPVATPRWGLVSNRHS